MNPKPRMTACIWFELTLVSASSRDEVLGNKGLAVIFLQEMETKTTDL